MNKNLKESLEELGFSVEVINEVYLLRTPNNNLLVVYYCFDELLKQNVWELQMSNHNTVNCYHETRDLIEALTNYLNPPWKNNK